MTARYYTVNTVREDKDGKKRWTKIGVAFPMNGRDGFNITLEALPIPTIREGKIEVQMVLFPPKDETKKEDSDAPW